MSGLLAFSLAFLAAGGVLLARLLSVYALVRRSFRRAAADLDLGYRELSRFRPQLIGHSHGRPLLVELTGRGLLPDSLRVTWGERVHTRAGVAVTAELLEEIVRLLHDAEARDRERAEGMRQ